MELCSFQILRGQLFKAINRWVSALTLPILEMARRPSSWSLCARSKFSLLSFFFINHSIRSVGSSFYVNCRPTNILVEHSELFPSDCLDFVQTSVVTYEVIKVRLSCLPSIRCAMLALDLLQGCKEHRRRVRPLWRSHPDGWLERNSQFSYSADHFPEVALYLVQIYASLKGWSHPICSGVHSGWLEVCIGMCYIVYFWHK